MRITVSIPEDVYRATAALARRLGVSRSAICENALAEYLDQHADDIVVHPLIRQFVEPILVEELAALEASAAPGKHENVSSSGIAQESARRLRQPGA